MNQQSQGPAGSSPGQDNAGLTGSSARSAVHDVLERAENAAGQLADKVEPVVSRLPREAQAPIYRAVHSAADAAGALADRADDLMEKQQDFIDSTTGYIRENPLRSIGYAFVAGWLFAKLT